MVNVFPETPPDGFGFPSAKVAEWYDGRFGFAPLRCRRDAGFGQPEPFCQTPPMAQALTL